MKKSALYIHVPFCVRKCDYCDFYSEKFDKATIEIFTRSLIQELAFYQNHSIFSNTKFGTIYFGGGTPSLLSLEQIETILEKIYHFFTIDEAAEITLEANPETLNREKLSQFRQLGINRISIGVQSFSDAELIKLGRIHNARQAIQSVEWANQAGFTNINIDLIFAIPDQSPARWLQNLTTAISLNPQHISAYCLTIAQGTPLEEKILAGEIKSTDVQIEREMYLFTIDFLNQHSFIQYEISNFARRGFECQHNKKYWNLSPYLGVGPSAHSYWQNQRQWNVKNIRTYIKKISSNMLPIADKEYLSVQQQEFEFIFLHLRTNEGLDLHRFHHFFRKDFVERYQTVIEKLKSYPGKILFKLDNYRFQLTPQGFLLFDEICSLFA